MKYQAVIFDLFGTLVCSVTDESYFASLHQMAGVLGADRDALAEMWGREEITTQRATGVLATSADCIRDVCGKLGLTPSGPAVEQAQVVRMEFTRRWLVPRADALQTLASIRQTGRRLALMSVCSAEVPEIWPQTPMAEFFDEPLFSCSLGMMKPDPRLYERACEQLGVPAAACLYVGDGAGSELTGARRAGMAAVLICPPGEAQIILARPGMRQWSGARITALSEVLGLLE